MTRTAQLRRRIAAALAAALLGATLFAGGGAVSADEDRDVNPAKEEMGTSLQTNAPVVQVIPHASDDIAIAPAQDLNLIENRDDRS